MVHSKAQILGHPLHPMLIPFPTSLYPVALLFDIVWLVTRDVFWLSAAFWIVALAFVFTLVAMVPGLIDYYGVVPKAGEVRRTANFHLVTGSSIAVVGLLSLALRYTAGAYTFGIEAKDVVVGLVYWGIALNALVNLALIAQGWWGGELVYRHHIGVERVGVEPSDTNVRGRVEDRTRSGGGEP